MSDIKEWTDAIVGREVVDIRFAPAVGWGNEVSIGSDGKPYLNDEAIEIVLDNGQILELNAELGCCAYGEIEWENVVGGTIMSVALDERVDESEYAAEDVYKIFLLKSGLPGSITVTSHLGSGYYGTGYSLKVRAPEMAAAR